MPETVRTLENNIRSMRIIYSVLLSAAIFYLLAAEGLFHHEAHDIHVMWLAFPLNGLIIVAIALFFRSKVLQPAAETLQAKSDDQSALARWRIGNLLSCLLAESAVLLGFALRLAGGRTRQSVPFCIVGIGLMGDWWPRRP
jgi:phosphate/sulfate permease